MKGFKPNKVKLKSTKPEKTIKPAKATNKSKAIIIWSIVIAVLLIVGIVVATMFINYSNDIKEIGISQFPTELKYNINTNQPDFSGLEIQIIKNNGSIETVKYTAETAHLFEFSGFDSSKAVEKQVIRGTYQNEYYFEFVIKIEEPTTPPPMLLSIEWIIKPRRSIYSVGEQDLDLTGAMIRRVYDDGSTLSKPVISDDVIGWEEARDKGAGFYTLKVKCKENGVTRYVTFEIEIR